MIHRREALQRLGGLLGAAALSGEVWAGAEDSVPTKRLGLVTYCCRFRREMQQRLDAADDLFEPFTFLEHCRSLRAGGMQISLGRLDNNSGRPTPSPGGRCGPVCLKPLSACRGTRTTLPGLTRTCRRPWRRERRPWRTVMIPGRRYERFNSLEEFREFEGRGRQALERAAPIAERHELPLAVENHKDHRNEERVALFEHIGQRIRRCVRRYRQQRGPAGGCRGNGPGRWRPGPTPST